MEQNREKEHAEAIVGQNREQNHEVEAIVGHRKVDGKVRLLCKEIERISVKSHRGSVLIRVIFLKFVQFFADYYFTRIRV